MVSAGAGSEGDALESRDGLVVLGWSASNETGVYADGL
jgi:hypothetical protein